MKEIEIIKGKHLEVSKVDWDEIETDDDFILPPLPQKRGKEIEIIKGGHTGICKVDWDRIE